MPPSNFEFGICLHRFASIILNIIGSQSIEYNAGIITKLMAQCGHYRQTFHSLIFEGQNQQIRLKKPIDIL